MTEIPSIRRGMNHQTKYCLYEKRDLTMAERLMSKYLMITKEMQNIDMDMKRIIV